MGIDIYAHWREQSKEELAAQLTGFSVHHGHVGYLREAYHGEPYATQFLVSEAFKTGDARIPAATLRRRLPYTLLLAEKRERTVYGNTDADAIARVKQSFVDFVELCEAKERTTGEPCLIVASF